MLKIERTPLYAGHVESRAKLVEFAGWEMPIQYSGVVDEYQAVRTTAGLFDVSHMGRIIVSGDDAARFLDRTTTNNVGKLARLASHYSMICNPQGGIKDDIFVYRLKPVEYLLCVNASNRVKIVQWLQDQLETMQPHGQVTVADASSIMAQLALQGPASRGILSALGVSGLDAVQPRGCLEAKLLGVPVFISRTGYTGELGYELYLPAEQALQIWKGLLDRGSENGLKPAGLGARDLLRLEMAYLLYGNDISEEITPLEAAAEWVVDFGKADFVGREALNRSKGSGLSRRLVAFELLQKAVPRHGFKIVSDRGQPIGEVTSGNLSPLLQKGIGLGYVPPDHAVQGSSLGVEIRGRTIAAKVVKPPFYKRKASGTHSDGA
jgi:aminomethyltransferase